MGDAAVFRLRRSPAQIEQLRDLCRAWGPPAQGNERFWAFDDVLAALALPGSVCLFAAGAEDGAWAGAALAAVGPDAADLMYLYVRAEHRQAGVARALLFALIACLKAETAAEALFLEVRTGNLGAQKLYEAFGMRRVGLRRRYYADGEDALVYRLEL